MKKSLKTILAAGLMSLSLASCGGPSQSVVDKINAAAETEKTSDDYTLKKCESALGKDYNSAMINGTGIATWSVTKGNTTKTVVVTFVKNVATGAVYSESTKESSK